VGRSDDTRDRRPGAFNSPGAAEIGFAIPERYNASRILFDNLGNGRGDSSRSSGRREAQLSRLCAEASKWATLSSRWASRRGDAS